MDDAEVDRLIEEGLSRYGRGDLDGALLVWEQVLADDPDNEQANSYVDYVRQNYDLLTGQAEGSDESSSPYAIEGDEYQIEILEGRVSSGAIPIAPLKVDPVDDGWSIEGSPFEPE